MLDPFLLVAAEEEAFRPGELGDAVSRLPAATFWAFVGSALLAQIGLFAASLALVATVVLYRWHEGRS